MHSRSRSCCRSAQCLHGSLPRSALWAASVWKRMCASAQCMSVLWEAGDGFVLLAAIRTLHPKCAYNLMVLILSLWMLFTRRNKNVLYCCCTPYIRHTRRCCVKGERQEKFGNCFFLLFLPMNNAAPLYYSVTRITFAFATLALSPLVLYILWWCW